MELRELARSVAERSGLSREESADLVRAVVEGLADQLSEGEARHLTVDVPEPLAAELEARPRRRPEAHPVALGEFIRQVSAHTGQPDREARTGTGAVLAALRDSMSEDAFRHLTGQLPAAYSELVAAVG